MPDYFKLTPFKKFSVWMDALEAFHAYPGLPFGQSKEVETRRDFGKDVKTSMQIVHDMLRLADRILRKELDDYQAEDPTIAIHADQDPRLEARRISRLASDAEGFLEFCDFLEQFRVLGGGLLRLEHFSRLEFKSLGYVVNRHVEAFRHSGAYGYFRQGDPAESEFRYLVRRDIVMSLEMPGIQEQVELIFFDFFRILQLIKYIRDEMRVRFKVRKLLVLFAFCFHSYKKFLELLQESRDYLDRYQPEIVEAIFSTTFALKMETKKVFEERLETLETETRARKAYAEMEDALGLTENAFRECFINLVKLLNPDFDERRLFGDMREKYDQTVVLIEDMRQLHDAAKHARDTSSDDDFAKVRRLLRQFDKTSKRLLFFKDWEDIEDFQKELAECDPAERPFALHRFEIFLTTLLSEVGKRAVLSKFSEPARAS